jgi:hypothetical protein
MKVRNARILSLAALGAAALACTHAAGDMGFAPTQSSRVEINKELGRRYFEEVWNRGNLDALDQLLAPN